jgi:hypothetical protein
MDDDRPDDIFGELALDRPQYLLAVRGVTLHRLLLDHFVDLRVAIAIRVPARPTAVKRVERRIGIRPAWLIIETDGEMDRKNC